MIKYFSKIQIERVFNMEKIRAFLQKKINIMCTLLFAAFMLLQLITLRLSNVAGRGYLPTKTQDKVYLFLQIFVIAGILCHVFVYRLIAQKIGYGGFITAVTVLCAVLAEVMLFMPESSAAYLVITAIAVLCLGFVCGAVYLKLSELIKDGASAGVCIAIGYSAALALQYVFQLRWTVKPVLALLTALSAAALAYGFLRAAPRENIEAQRRDISVPRSRLIFFAAIILAMMTFEKFYNIYIHHLQIASGYTEYNFYTWPRLLMIPAMLLLGLLAEIKSGRLMPICCLCTVVFAMLNAVLGGEDTYLLSMCLYYIALAAVVAYYHVTFLKAAQSTDRPALWAVMGRMLDSLFVIITFIPAFSSLPGVAALILDIAALCVILFLMAINGDLVLNSPTPVPVPCVPADPFVSIAEEFGITPSEMKVLRELVQTDDKQDVIALRLNISVSTLRHHITSIYKKTGTQTRLALSKLVDGVRSK